MLGRSSRPLISILIPTYNRAIYLKDIIERLLCQTYKNIEIIITDDCSTDNTKEVVLSFSKENRIRYIRRDVNMWPYLNFFTTLCFDSCGQFAFYHADDDYVVDNNWLAEVVELLNTNFQIGMVHSGWAALYDESNEVKETILDIEDLVEAENFFGRFTPDDHMLHTFVFDRDLAAKYAIDSVDWKRAHHSHILEPIFMTLCNKKIAYIKRATMHYRLHKKRQTNEEIDNSIDKYLPPAIQYLRLLDTIGMNFKNMDSWIQKTTQKFFSDSYNGFINGYEVNKLKFYEKCLCALYGDTRKKILYGYGILGSYLSAQLGSVGIVFDYCIIDNQIPADCNIEVYPFARLHEDIGEPKIVVIATFSHANALAMIKRLLYSGCISENIDEIIVADDFI